MYRILILLVVEICFFTQVKGQNILPNGFPVTPGNKKEKEVMDDQPFPLRAFTYSPLPVLLPDSLGGKRFTIDFYAGIWLDSSGKTVSIHLESVYFYRKTDLKKIKQYRDSDPNTIAWENITPCLRRYIEWITSVLSARLRFKRLYGPPPPGSRYLPVKEKNFFPFSVRTE